MTIEHADDRHESERIRRVAGLLLFPGRSGGMGEMASATIAISTASRSSNALVSEGDDRHDDEYRQERAAEQ
jgi:hypothetical protein